MVDIQGKANEIQLSVKAYGSQTADTFEVKNTSGTKTVYVNSAGTLNTTLLNIPTSQAPSPTAGSMYYDSQSSTLFIHNGTTWTNIQLN